MGSLEKGICSEEMKYKTESGTSLCLEARRWGGEDLDGAFWVVPIFLTSSELLESRNHCYTPSSHHWP